MAAARALHPSSFARRILAAQIHGSERNCGRTRHTHGSPCHGVEKRPLELSLFPLTILVLYFEDEHQKVMQAIADMLIRTYWQSGSWGRKIPAVVTVLLPFSPKGRNGLTVCGKEQIGIER